MVLSKNHILSTPGWLQVLVVSGMDYRDPVEAYKKLSGPLERAGEAPANFLIALFGLSHISGCL